MDTSVSLFSYFRTLPRLYCRQFCSSRQKYETFIRYSPLGTIFTNNKTCLYRSTRSTYSPFNSTQIPNVIGPQIISRNCSKYVSPSRSSFYFDTHMMVTDLHKCGFTLSQSEVITSAIADVVQSTVGNVKGNSVSRVEQEQLEVRLKSLIEKVRNDMIILEKTEFVRMKDECEKLKSEVASLKFLLQEEVVKLKSSQALDTSLERSRVKEEFQFRDQKIKDNNNRIDTEVARVETKIEAQKLDLLKYLVGSVLSMCTIILAFWRFFKM